MKFKGRLIIITGGSSGLGKALAQKLFNRGASLALMARDKSKLKAVRDDLRKSARAGQKVEIFPCDVSDYARVEQTMKTIVDTLGLPYLLINSAGVISESYFEKQSLQTFHRVMDINFFGTLHCIKAVLPYFQQRKKGRIVNICSMAGLMGVFGYSAYCSSKHAIAGLTHTLRAELKPQKIRFHLVCPPEFASPMVEELSKYRSAENREMAQTIPVLNCDLVADSVIRGMEKGRYEIVPGALTRLIRMIDRISPTFGRAAVDYRLKKISSGRNLKSAPDRP